MPTVLDLSGLPIPEKVQGQSLVPLMAAAREAGEGGSPEAIDAAAAKLGWTPQPAVTEKSDDPQGENPKGLLSYAIVDGGWKLVHNVKSPDQRPEFELYNHAEDPLDTKTCSASTATWPSSSKPSSASGSKRSKRKNCPRRIHRRRFGEGTRTLAELGVRAVGGPRGRVSSRACRLGVPDKSDPGMPVSGLAGAFVRLLRAGGPTGSHEPLPERSPCQGLSMLQ